MNTPLIIWASVAIVMIVLVATRMFRAAHHLTKQRHHLLEIGSERDEIWIPGDPLRSTQDLNDDID